MFQGIKNGGALIKESIKAFIKHPQMLIPLLLCWLIYAPILVIFKFHIPWNNYEFSIKALIVFLAILLLSSIFSWSAFVLLELIKQIETQQKANIFKAFYVSKLNTIRALPIVSLWATIWFFIAVIEAMLTRRTDEDEDENTEYNAENVAKTVAGFEQFSLSAVFFDALKKGVRMLAFIIYPAIAWENLNTIQSIKKGFVVAKSHKTEFVSGFIITELAALIVFLPPAILFFISGNVDFPDMVWFATMIYCAFALSFTLFLEQMFVAELYLWHLIWEKEVNNAEANGDPKPTLAEVKRPSVVDNVADMYLTNVQHKNS